MADKRISQLVERINIANNDVLPIVASGAITTNKVTISTIQDWMQDNLDVGVTSVGITLGTTGTDINVTGSPVTSSGNITINLPTASATNRGALSSADWSTFNSKVSSVGLSMPSAFTVSNSPITGSGTIAVTGAGTVSQYVRGDGSLADFPQSGGGGGSVSYYLNSSVSQGTIGGIAYREMNKVPILGAGTDLTIAADGYIASYITDAGDPALLEIPAGNWNFETFFSASSGGGSPTFYIELYKVNSGGTATLIASNSGTPELISLGTNINPYFSALAVPTTTLALTDRLALRYYVTPAGRTITLHTENSHLCQIITTFTTGLTALNGLTAQVQNFATGSSGTDFTISSSTSTHTFNIPSASATNRGLVTTGSQTFAGAKTFNSDIIVNGITVGKGGASNGNNTAVGLNALSSNTTGTLNTATGLSALQVNTAGNSNTANGANSLVANTTGGFNTGIGNQSLYSNTTGQANTAIGLNSLYSNTTGTYNTGIGSGAGYYIADGSTPNTTSDFSIYLGADTKASVDNAQNETVIGYNAIGSGSNTVTIGNSSVTDNYFTGTVRSTSLRLAAAGTADPTFFRNTSGTSSSTSNANVLGFNSVNNIFLTTHSRGGFVLDFNNSVSNRTYTLQDASGTLAFTSQIPSVAGVYLPLAGGTLTGALNGTSGTFTGAVSGSAVTITATTGIAGDFTNNSSTNEALRARNNGSGNIAAFRNLSAEVASITNSGGLTLSGALNGTSAAFAINNTSVGNATNLNLQQAGSGDVAISYLLTGAREWLVGVDNSDSDAFKINNITGSSDFNNTGLSIATTGTATFSSSVGIGAAPTGTYGTLSVSGGVSIKNDSSAKLEIGRYSVGVPNSYIKLGPSSNSLRFTNNTDAADLFVIENGGNVGIGTNSPTTKLHVESPTGTDTVARFSRGPSNAGDVLFGIGDYGGGNQCRIGAQQLAFEVNRTNGAGLSTGTTAMFITSGGTIDLKRSSGSALILNIETTSGFSGGGILLNMDAGGDAISIGGSGTQNAINVTNSNKKVIISNLGGSGTVTVQADNSGTLIKSSDSSLKQEDKEHKIEGLAEILQLQPRAYKWLKDIEIRKEEAVTEIGFFADEVNPIIPSAAPKGFDGLYGFNDRAVIASLVKAIQEQQIQINSLKNQMQ